MGVLLVTLALLAVMTPLPWALLWIAVPLAVATSLLAGWRFGARGVWVPIVAFVVVLTVAGPMAIWAWWIPVASLTGLWMGLREEGEGPPLGERAWMLLPLLLLAAALPWAMPYAPLVRHVNSQLAAGDSEFVRQYALVSKRMGITAEQLKLVETSVVEQAKARQLWLPQWLPTAIFIWMLSLVMAGRSIGTWAAYLMRWPPVSRAAVARWRLPDGALWLFFAGTALLLARLPAWEATGWTLSLIAAMGFGVQGIAVVESLALVRGVPLTVIVIMLLFMSVMAFPAFAIAAFVVGFSDMWLDYRKLEPAVQAEDS